MHAPFRLASCLSLLVTAAGATMPVARAADYTKATLDNLPHRDTDGFSVTPADGGSLMATFRSGEQQLRLQVHEASVPAAGSMPGANGVTAASIGGCVVDEAGLLVSGWGTDANGEAYSRLPQILGSATAAGDTQKIAALSAWCDAHAVSWRSFSSLARELEFESAVDQEATLGPRTAAWLLILAQARNLEALCLFSKHQSGQGSSVRDAFTR